MSFQINQQVLAQLHGVFRSAIVEGIDDGSAASIVDGGSSTTSAALYYVHFVELDRRMDRWLSANAIRAVPVKMSSATSAGATTSKAVIGSKTGGRRGGGRAEPTMIVKQGSIMVAGGKRSRDSRFFYRPKNVATFVMGWYEFDAWYYTPFALANVALRCALEDAARSCAVSTSVPLSVDQVSLASELGEGSAAGNDADGAEPTRTPRGGAPFPASALAPNAEVAGVESVKATASSCTIHLCPFCVTPYCDGASVERHIVVACRRHPPGREIYRDPVDGVVVFECDGRAERAFCERLALLSKAFLEHKTVDFDMSLFVFHVVCFVDGHGCHVAGYFSKEKANQYHFNLSCILTLPPFQGRGVGRFLIELSYEMSRREGRMGTPETPLSDLGERLYHSYWKEAMLDAFLVLGALDGVATTLDVLMRTTGMVQADVVWALRTLNILELKSNAGGVSGTTVTATAVVSGALHCPEAVLRRHIESKLSRLQREHIVFNPALLAWFPYHYCLASMGPRPPTKFVVAVEPRWVADSQLSVAAAMPPVDIKKEKVEAQDDSSGPSSARRSSSSASADRKLKPAK